jgi:hypothetical protein
MLSYISGLILHGHDLGFESPLHGQRQNLDRGSSADATSIAALGIDEEVYEI